MENMGIVSNFVEIGKRMFGEVCIQYEVKNDTEDSDPAVLKFYLTREIDSIVYSAEKEFHMFITTYGILLTSEEGDRYFEKYNFQSVVTWEDVLKKDQEDCPSFIS